MANKEVNLKFVFAVIVAALGSGFSHGYHIGVLNSPQDEIKRWIGKIEKKGPNSDTVDLIYSFVAAIINLGGTFGGLVSGVIAFYLGPKLGLVLNNILAIISCGMMTASYHLNSHILLIVGRFVMGLNNGINAGLCPMYLSEISPISIRGAVGSMYQLVITISIALAMTLGIREFLGKSDLWWSLFLIPVPIAIFQMLGFLVCSDSPKYLIASKRGSDEKAEKSLKWLRDTNDVGTEMAILKAENEAAKAMPKVTLKSMFKTKSLRTPLMISMVILLAQQWSGINAIMFYGGQIFKSAGISQEDVKYPVIFGIGMVNVIMTVVSVFLVEIAGRKTLLLVGFAGMAVDTALFAICALLMENNIGSKTLSYVCILLVIIYIILFAAGAGSIPWFLVSELFTQSARPTAISLAVPINWTANFILTLAYPHLNKLLKGGEFFIFSGLDAIFSVFILFLVPETKNKSIEEITALFSN